MTNGTFESEENNRMIREYVHEKILTEEYEKAGKEYKRNSKYGKKGDMKDPQKYQEYRGFYEKKYLPMRKAVEKLDFENHDDKAFQKCATVLNKYWKELEQFRKRNSISDNSKLHTNFLEEFSCYFFSKLPSIDKFDIFVSDVFAGLKILPSHEIKQITKDVDFCIGNKLTVLAEEKKNIGGMDLRIPAVSVEVKSYVDATMLGEIMNTARKIKGANPGSKVILVTWINSFADEHAIEAAFDSAIDEIVVISDRKRSNKENTVIEFTQEGLRDYYEVVRQALEEVMNDEPVPAIGRLLAYVRHARSIKN